jgi:hypothetical protein
LIVIWKEVSGVWLENSTSRHGHQATGRVFDDRLQYTAGFYYYNLDGREVASAYALTPLAGILVNNINEQETKSVSGYGELRFEVVDGFNIFGGVRYTDEKTRLDIRNRVGENCAVPGFARAGQYQSMPSFTPSLRKDGLNHNMLVLLNNFRIGLLRLNTASRR